MFLVTTLAAIVAAGALSVAPSGGDYVRSDGFMHERLTLSTSGTFMYEETGCVGGPTRYQGQAQLKADRVSIEGRHGVLERELTAVTWGQRRYLVPPVQMKRFCTYVSGKSLEEPIPFFLRIEDQSKATPSATDRPSQCR